LGFVFLGILILKKYLILGSGYFYGANKKLTDFLSAGVSQQHTQDRKHDIESKSTK